MKSQNNNPPSPAPASGQADSLKGSGWEKINKVFEGADQIRVLEKLYMERGNVTFEEAQKWAIEQFEKHSPTASQPETSEAEVEKRELCFQVDDIALELYKNYYPFPSAGLLFRNIARFILSHTATLRATVAGLEGDLLIRKDVSETWERTTYINANRITKLETTIDSQAERVRELEKELEYISELHCGVKVEGDVTHTMVSAFVDGLMEKYSDVQDNLQTQLSAARLEADGHAKRIVELLEQLKLSQESAVEAMAGYEKRGERINHLIDSVREKSDLLVKFDNDFIELNQNLKISNQRIVQLEKELNEFIFLASSGVNKELELQSQLAAAQAEIKRK